jgi:hypothetical protein
MADEVKNCNDCAHLEKYVSTRECGDCSVCCYVGGVPELRKNPHSQCPYENKGCTLYGSPDRPNVCYSFACSWLHGAGMLEDRPDISGVQCSANMLNGGKWMFVIEVKPNAVMTTGKSMVKTLTALSNVPVIIVDYNSKPPCDRGNRVVVKNALLARCSKRLIGEFLGYLDNDKSMGIYKLVIN